MTRNIKEALGKIGNERGSNAESSVHRALSSETEIINPSWIKGYEIADKKDDARGIDGWVDTDVGKIPIQIKSSIRNRAKAEEKHPKIPVIVISAGMTDQEIIDRCVSAVKPIRKKYLAQRKKT